MNQKTFADQIDPEPGQVYKIERNDDYYQLLYVDEQVVLLRSDEPGRAGGNVHRIERRIEFEKQVDSGWFVYQPDSDLDMISFDEIDWTDVNHIGEKTSDNLHKAGYVNRLDIQQATDSELLDVDRLGPGGLSNLKEYAQ
jgi:hypothetical protein